VALHLIDADKGVANGVASLDAGSKVPVAQLPTIPASQVSLSAIAGVTGATVQLGMAFNSARLAVLESITGQYVGTSATYAGLPTTDQQGAAVANGDWATLTVVDGLNPKGIYIFDGTNWVLGIEVPALTASSLATINQIITSAREIDTAGFSLTIKGGDLTMDEAGDILFAETGGSGSTGGPVIFSPNGTKYRITVTDTGAMDTVSF